MAEFKGTKGKWFISEVDNPNEHNDNTGCHTLSVEGDVRYGFIDVWFGDNFQCGSKNEALHNALLISKAPEMLEMLIDFVETYESGGIINNDHYIGKFKQLIKESTEL